MGYASLTLQPDTTSIECRAEYTQLLRREIQRDDAVRAAIHDAMVLPIKARLRLRWSGLKYVMSVERRKTRIREQALVN